MAAAGAEGTEMGGVADGAAGLGHEEAVAADERPTTPPPTHHHTKSTTTANEGEGAGAGEEVLQLRHEKQTLRRRQTELEVQYEEVSEANLQLEDQVQHLKRKVREQEALLQRRAEMVTLTEQLERSNEQAHREILQLKAELVDCRDELTRSKKVARGQELLTTFLNREYFRSDSRNSLNSRRGSVGAEAIRPLPRQMRKTIGSAMMVEHERMRLGSLDKSLQSIRSKFRGRQPAKRAAKMPAPRASGEAEAQEETPYRGPPASLLAMAEEINKAEEDGSNADEKAELVEDLNRELSVLRDALDEERERTQQMHLDMERLKRLRDVADGKGTVLLGHDAGETTTESSQTLTLADELAGTSSTDDLADAELAHIDEGGMVAELHLQLEVLGAENTALLERLAEMEPNPEPGTEAGDSLIATLQAENMELRERGIVTDKRITNLDISLGEARAKYRQAMEDALAAEMELSKSRQVFNNHSPMVARARRAPRGAGPSDPTQFDHFDLPSAMEQRSIQLQLKQLDVDDGPELDGPHRLRAASTVSPRARRPADGQHGRLQPPQSHARRQGHNENMAMGLRRSHTVAGNRAGAGQRGARPASKPQPSASVSISSWFNSLLSGSASKPNAARGVGMLPSAKNG